MKYKVFTVASSSLPTSTQTKYDVEVNALRSFGIQIMNTLIDKGLADKTVRIIVEKGTWTLRFSPEEPLEKRNFFELKAIIESEIE